nr:carboxypeptidase regulatory-like domain-containing protein [Pseudenhygromyxa sp. WMMC2535]
MATSATAARIRGRVLREVPREEGGDSEDDDSEDAGEADNTETSGGELGDNDSDGGDPEDNETRKGEPRDGESPNEAGDQAGDQSGEESTEESGDDAADLADPEASDPEISESAGDDPELAALLAELPPHELLPPLPGSCHARAWRDGQLVTEEITCDDEGRFELVLSEPALSGTVHVELLIDGHLRGLVAAEIPPADEGAVPDPAARVVQLPTVALGPGLRVAGQTLDARGQPLADVRVQAMPIPNLDEPEPWRTRSDAEGRFEFTTLPRGPLSLRAIAPGYALSVVEAIAPEDQVLMVLDALIDLEGAAVGSPERIARAKVRLEGSSVWPAIEQPLEADGSFVFERLPDGIYGVEIVVPPATAGGQEYASVPLENVTPDLRVNLALVPAFRVPVRVVDPEGAPVPGARVTLGYGQLGMLQKIAQTDEEGRAEVGPVVPGPYYLHADADGFLPPEPVEVEVGSEGFVGAEGLDEQTLVLARPARISGVVLDEDDRPVPGAEVMLDSEAAFSVGEGDTRQRLFAVAIGAADGSLGVTKGEVPDIPLFPEDDVGVGLVGVRSDEYGRFELDLLLPGEHRLWAVHRGHAASAVQTFDLRSGEIREGVTLRLREGVPLTGVVRSANQNPIAGVQIDLGDGLILTTDERGVFDAGYRRGPQKLILRGRGLIPKLVEIQLGDSPVDLDVELEPARETLDGRVVDGNGRPIADVEVALRPLDGLSPAQVTWTDDKGGYRFDALGPGKVELEFEHGDYVPVETRAQVGPDEPAAGDLVLVSGWQADVLVRSALRGDPIEGATLHAGHMSATTDAKGRAVLDRLVGELDLEISAPGWVGRSASLRDDGSGRVELTVELTEGGSIAGVIDDDIGDPVVNATIRARSSSGELLGEARSDGRGRWRIDGVPPGDIRLSATPPEARAAGLAPIEDFETDVLRGELTKDVQLRFERP